jgi:hypothetical protein
MGGSQVSALSAVSPGERDISNITNFITLSFVLSPFPYPRNRFLFPEVKLPFFFLHLYLLYFIILYKQQIFIMFFLKFIFFLSSPKPIDGRQLGGGGGGLAKKISAATLRNCAYGTGTNSYAILA